LREIPVRRACSTLSVISAERATAIERELASLVGVEPNQLRDYLRGYIKAGRARRTGFRFVRGTHGGDYVHDPQGVDELPGGFQAPRS
jgi:predicted transcriptional regulator